MARPGLSSTGGSGDQMAAPLISRSSRPDLSPRGILLTTGLPHPRLRTAAALAFALLATLLALATPAQSRRAAPCTARGHTVHLHGCAAPGRKARHTSSAKRHHGAHSPASTRHARRTTPPRSATAPAGATCEDGSAPAPVPSVPCADGSEPACTDGSSPIAGSVAAPGCPASPEHEADGTEVVCEDTAGQPCDPAEEDPGSACGEGSSAPSAARGASFVCEG
jgi:hypothetical protein